ncbi:MAG: hypothetical protein A4E67_00431 [Syntrophaceae bacterium PtaB.Bin038]|jgi:hypothetical protein|nr:MAG: hypothetical protein A4E67_00431 [Syntrophaceae bacterium PtaB.Bin038]
MDQSQKKKKMNRIELPTLQSGSVCALPADAGWNEEIRVMNIDLVVIDLTACARCVPTGDQLEHAVRLLTPVAEAMGIELKYRAIVVQSEDEAKQHALLSSPTIRINGRDIAQDIRESVCESCGDLTENNTVVDCREWHYRGKVYSSAPLPMLLEVITGAMLNIDKEPPVTPAPLDELPDNLKTYFANKKRVGI